MSVGSKSWGKWLLPMLLVAAIGGGAASFSTRWDSSHAQEPTPKVQAGMDQAADLSSAFRYVAGKLKPSVVSIQTRTEVRVEGRSGRSRPSFPGLPPEFERFFDRDFFEDLPRGPMRQEGQGTGVIVSADGLIVTNNHVVRNAQTINVVTHDRKTYTAKVVGADPKTDIAVIRIDANGLTPAKLGDSDAAEVGDWVVAIGSPFGLAQTVTAGIVSAKGRSLSITDYEDFIQTDAAINPGNSGGPLVNLKGEIIGINTAIASRSGAYNGVGFAIPSNIVQSVVKSLTTNGGVVRRGMIGAGIQDLDEGLAKSFNYTGQGGALIAQVMPNSPAEKAGLKEGDIVTKFNGKAIESSSQLRSAVATSEPGKKVELEVFRDGKSMDVSVTLAELTPDVLPVAQGGAGETFSDLGIAVQDANAALAEQYDLPADAKGVVVTYVDEDGLAARVGVREGDMIVAVAGKPVNSVEEYRKATASMSIADGIRLTLQSKQGRRLVFLQQR
jgi:serine protease Do